MGQHETAVIDRLEVIGQPDKSRSTNIRYSVERDLPMLLAIRNASFISHGQMFDQLVARGSEASRRAFNWRLQRLVKAGVVVKLPPLLPYCGPFYSISRSGLACLEACGQGLMSLTSARSGSFHMCQRGLLGGAQSATLPSDSRPDPGR
jgi:hypothetical protein